MLRLFLFSLFAVKRRTKRMERARKLSLVSKLSRKRKRVLEMCARHGSVSPSEDRIPQ